MEHRCKNCEFWSREPNDFGNTYCNLEAHYDTGTLAEDGMRYQYNEGGYIECGPEFGCVNFEQAAENTTPPSAE